MKYIIKISVKLENQKTDEEKSQWHVFKKEGDIVYRWRLRNDKTYEVAIGLFEDRTEALRIGKLRYVSLLDALIRGGFEISNTGCEGSYETNIYSEEYDGPEEEYYKNEEWFFSTKKMQRNQNGLKIYEVNETFEELDSYTNLSLELEIEYDREYIPEQIDKHIFSYNEETHEFLKRYLDAKKENDTGKRMTAYCGLLEQIAGKTLKTDEVLNAINELKKKVKELVLNKEEKGRLIGYLDNYKWESSKKKIKDLCHKYGKEKYGGKTSNEIIDEAYSLRSSAAHGNEKELENSKATYYMGMLVLDVMENYLKEKQIASKHGISDENI